MIDLLAVSLALATGPGQPVRPGIEVLLSDSLHLIAGRSIGLVTNVSAVDSRGVHIVDRLRDAGVRLVALFSPEHGFRGAAEPGEAVASTVDSATGIPIYSLYGRTPQPTDEMLAGIDLILVDLPDAGARYYTYLHTTVGVMRSAGRLGKTVIVLDRPDPIGGRIAGNILDPAFRSAIGSLEMPMRHGMTLGEQARLARHDLGLTAELVVVPVAGWRRQDDGLVTGLPFLPPSPNLKDLESLFHYPGTCLFEGTALSVGRGTDMAFHQVGAPWLDTAAVLRIVRRARLPGVAFLGVAFTPVRPGDGKLAGVRVQGIRLKLLDPRRYDPVRTAVTLLAAVKQVHPDSIRFHPPHFDRLAGGSGLRIAIEAGVPARKILEGWKADQRRFEARSEAFLIYR